MLNCSLKRLHIKKQITSEKSWRDKVVILTIIQKKSSTTRYRSNTAMEKSKKQLFIENETPSSEVITYILAKPSTLRETPSTCKSNESRNCEKIKKQRAKNDVTQC